MKKSLIVSMILVLCFAMILAGCAENNDAKQSSSETKGSTENAKDDRKKFVQLIVGANVQEFPNGITKDDNFIINYWKEQTGYDIDFNILPSDGASEKLNSMLISGEAKGVIIIQDFNQFASMVDQGVLTPLDDYIKGSELEGVFASSQDLGRIDGKQYAFMIPDGIANYGSSFVVRKDWLAEKGITEQPKTFNEFNNMLSSFKERGKDVIPLGIYGSPADWGWSTLKGFFGLQHDFALQDGKIVYNLTTPKAKEYLTYLRGLYNDGIINKDFSGISEQDLEQLFIGDKIGVLNAVTPWSLKTSFPALKEKSNGDPRFMITPTGVDGKPSYIKNFPPANFQVAIAKGTKDVEAAIDFISFLLKPETQQINNFGIEGQHFTKTDGKIAPTEEGKTIGWSTYYKYIMAPEEWYNVYGVMADWNEFLYPTFANASTTDVDPTVFMPLQLELVSAMDKLNSITNKFYTEAVMGETSVDKFDNYVKEWLSSGGQKVLDGYNKAYEDLGSPKYEYSPYQPGDGYQGVNMFDGHK